MADVPRDLLEQVSQLEALFTVDAKKLKEITEHFVSELDKGLSTEGGSIPMNVTWVMDWPTGKETGTYLALDMGGTNLRVAEITLDGKRGFDVIQSKYHMPKNIKTGTSDELWDYIAGCLEQFLASHHAGQEITNVHLGFTFSYPCTQPAINKGILQRWTKGFDIDGVEGQDIQPLLDAALKKRNVPITVVAIINDTTGTLVASNYTDPFTKMGCIFGTGCNAAYYEVVKNIPKLKGHVNDDIKPDSVMAINCEWGAFDNEHAVLPRTSYDVKIDEESPRPHQQAFEKMIAGYYLGEILRLTLADLHKQGFVFEKQDITKLDEPYTLDTSFLSRIEEDPWENLSDVELLFQEELDLRTTEPERKLIRRLAELIGTRAARLSACGVAAICKKTGMTECHVGADGSVVNKYPLFKERGAQALKEILDWDIANPDDYPVKVTPAEDGSGVGAAIIAALTAARVEKNLSVGLKA
ncbi:hexokinase 2 [Sugiyamaella lignohabitans]|uniref:Phosphotransferase n=1 Tax=Sugiyamaella lignohabitans TaxID=796027 RepID=A0A167F8V8_9ASCO|nr:hexokinase 2 [Sugiyamaella lignohabitans]ANB14971.1 hexokinase 2 [Sugiyamaella lignohabitans]